MTTLEMELALASFFDIRRNLIVPNVSWGVGLHECDLLIVRPSGCAIEVEIKVSIAGLKMDRGKRHGHRDGKNRIGRLYFAIPEKLHEKAIEHIPERAGIIVVYDPSNTHGRVQIRREAEWNRAAKFDEKTITKVAHLGAMRIWGLKRKLIKAKNDTPRSE